MHRTECAPSSSLAGCVECGPSLRLLRALYDDAVAAADLRAVELRGLLPERGPGRYVVVGAGKAAAAMAAAVEAAAEGPVEGVVIVPYGHSLPCRSIEVVEAAHPVPDEAASTATAKILGLLSELGPDDRVVALVSGGGSALLNAPIPGVDPELKRDLARSLLRSGAPIAEMNLVRTHLSTVKGGGLSAAAHPAPVHTLLVSDVPGDDPAVIASGPTFARRREPARVEEILRRHGVAVPPGVAEAITAHAGRMNSRLVPDGSFEIVASPQLSLEAAAASARAAGVQPLILGDAIEGEARHVGTVLAGIARQVVHHDQPVSRPCVLLSGGETTVTVRGNGRGGRNVELLLSMAIALDGQDGVYALSADTDGIDGAEPVAGAVICPHTLGAVEAAGISATDLLADNDAHRLFEAVDAQVVTGPTLTNVNDFRAVLVR